MALSACALGAMLFAGMAAAAGGSLADAQARYREDRAACTSGQSYQDRRTCLREAAAALAEAKRGRLADRDSSYERNQLLRCDRLSGEDRDDCVRRMRGEGTVSGSVEGGGVYRELRRTVPAK
jgi:hypothetical protein